MQNLWRAQKKSTNVKNTQMVTRVGRRLADAVENYLRNNGYADEVKNFQWEFNLVQDKQANAFCMPGGKNCCLRRITTLYTKTKQV